MMDFNNYIDRFLKETTEKVDAEIRDENMKAMSAIGDPMFAVYKSFVTAGFTKVQALELVKALLVSAINGTMKK